MENVTIRDSKRKATLMTISKSAKAKICKYHSIPKERTIVCEKFSNVIHVFDGDTKTCSFTTRYISNLDKISKV